MKFDRQKILQNMHFQLKIGRRIVGAAVGSGFTAKYVQEGGADLILALNSGRFRHMGRGSLAAYLPYANCNRMVMEFASREILPIIDRIPVIFGLCATDPTVSLPFYLDEIREAGFAGINNYPSVGHFEGIFAEVLQEHGISYDQEIEAVRLAHARNLLTVAFVFTPDQAEQMLEAGADIVCAHLGITKGGALGAKKVISLEAGAENARTIFARCDALRHDTIKMVYGGPVETFHDVKYIYDNTDAMGYLGGSSFERIPLEDAITRTTREFKKIGTEDQERLLAEILDGIEKHYDYVKFAKEYVRLNYMNEISFSDLAAVAHISRTYFSVLFKKEVGVTFPQYLNQYRIHKAVEIAKGRRLPMKRIAELVGYGDYAHFSKVFKKQMGISPKNFLNENKKT